jgi:cytoskeletal protein RodZ
LIRDYSHRYGVRKVAMSTLGETLRGERLRRGLKPQEVAAEIKISPFMVEAMEAGRFDRLPGGAYRRSFLRQYARILGFDEEEIVAEFRQEYGEAEVALPRLSRFTHRKVPMAAIWVVVAGMVCSAAYKFLPKVRLGLPERRVAASIVQAAPPQTAQPQFTPPVETPPPKLSADPKPAEPAAPPVQVVLTSTEPVWVSVQCDGLSAFRGMIESNAPKEFSATKKVTVLAGNSGPLAISLNGRIVDRIGARGEIQLVELTPQGARVVPRRRTPAPGSSKPGDEDPDAI